MKEASDPLVLQQIGHQGDQVIAKMASSSIVFKYNCQSVSSLYQILEAEGRSGGESCRLIISAVAAVTAEKSFTTDRERLHPLHYPWNVWESSSSGRGETTDGDLVKLENVISGHEQKPTGSLID